MIMEEEVRKLKRYPIPKKRVRLGDSIEKVLAPIVRVLDDNLGTDFKNCSGCEKRKEWLNNLTEDI
jgi:hypothetical protein